MVAVGGSSYPSTGLFVSDMAVSRIVVLPLCGLFGFCSEEVLHLIAIGFWLLCAARASSRTLLCR